MIAVTCLMIKQHQHTQHKESTNMRTFLEEVTGYILEHYTGKTGELCIVTPNRRAGLFFRKYFSAQVTRPIWAPEIMSVEDFINKISGYTICDQLRLLFEFYTVYRQTEKEHADDFDTFFSWAPALLRDFDDIDNALADPDKLFAHLEDIRYIDTWNPDGSELTGFQKDYLAFIKKLRIFHGALADHLTQMNMAWQGLSSRRAANNIETGNATLPWEKIIFTGFNALTQAEETIIKTLLQQGRAEYIIDSDPYYVSNPGHEAGHFIRKYMEQFGLRQRDDTTSLFNSIKKNIHLYGVAKNVNQARLAGNLLKHPAMATSDESTAVVLANEHLLIPMLNALPGDTTNINVTMGYPLSKTNMFGFFDILMKMHMRVTEPGKDNDRQPAWYHKDLYRLFSHSNSSLLWDTGKGGLWTTRMLHLLAVSGQSVYTFDELADLSEDKVHFARTFWFLKQKWQQGAGGIINVFVRITESFDLLFREKAAQQGRDIIHTPFFADFESLFYFAKIFRQTEGFLERYPFLSTLKTFCRLIRQAAAETSLSFTGEPLRGLQVMGMLETRNLDFDNIILLSANENILPKPKSSYSLIPYEVKRAFGLRLYNEQDAIYAYHFYRLLQRAKNITIVYNTQSHDLGSNEKSRFVTQLQYELPRYNQATRITEQIVPIQPSTDQPDGSLTIPKTEEILKRLGEIAHKGFSPSALSKYIHCPLQFYFEKVARIEEAEEVEETMETRTIGNIVHGVLEDLYKDYGGQQLQAKHLDAMWEKRKAAIDHRFGIEYKTGNIRAGKNLLLYHLSGRYVENLLKAERDFINDKENRHQPVILLSVEETFRTNLQTGNERSPSLLINLTGKADRTDRMNNVIRIIDYKTGKVDARELKFIEWDMPLTDSEKVKSFQLLCYAWLYRSTHPGNDLIEPGIVSVRNPSLYLQTLEHPGGREPLSPDHLASFETGLKKLLEEIMDPARPFDQTNDEKNCTYCAFSKLCRRF